MADQASIDSVGKKFEQWAQSLPEDEQAVVAEWMTRASGAEVQAYGANWWQSENAWSGAWNSWWSG